MASPFHHRRRRSAAAASVVVAVLSFVGRWPTCLATGRYHYAGDDDLPPYPAHCPLRDYSGPKIPSSVLLAADYAFRKHGGAVITHDSDTVGDNDEDEVFNRTAKATEDYVNQISDKLTSAGWDAFPTPPYELDPDWPDWPETGFRGCDVCSPPEPYPFRTSLPEVAMPRCAQAPYAVFIPATYEDAASAINIVRKYGEVFTVISGGHDYECQSGVPDGVLIITSLLNKLEVDYDKGTLTAGAGNLWQTLYDKLNDDEVDGTNDLRQGVMGAQCGFVSVSGYSLGGGLSWHMSKLHGMGSDSVLSMKVVTADGELVDATLDNEYRDLRWAMAGTGGMSLGLAVEFTYELKKSIPGKYLMTRYEYRFYPDPQTETGRYTIDAIPEIVSAWAEALDEIDDDEFLGPKIGSIRARLRLESYGHRLQIRAMCSHGIDLRTYPGFVRVTEAYAPLSDELEEYSSINDYVKTRRNRYPDTEDNPRVSSFVKGRYVKKKKGGKAKMGGKKKGGKTKTGGKRNLGGKNKIGKHKKGGGKTKKGNNEGHNEQKAFLRALDIHLQFYLDVENEEADRPVAGTDVDFYLLRGFVKNPERTSLNPAAAEAKWHITNRAKHPYDPELERRIRCKNREITKRLKAELGSEWAGPYWNYLDSSADKADYYGKFFHDVERIKDKYDPHNLFKKIKGIRVDDDKEIQCLEHFCDGYEGYWKRWDD